MRKDFGSSQEILGNGQKRHFSGCEIDGSVTQTLLLTIQEVCIRVCTSALGEHHRIFVMKTILRWLFKSLEKAEIVETVSDTTLHRYQSCFHDISTTWSNWAYPFVAAYNESFTGNRLTISNAFHKAIPNYCVLMLPCTSIMRKNKYRQNDSIKEYRMRWR